MSTPTIQQAIDRITSRFEATADEHTVDTIKSGDPSEPVRGIVVTFMATREVLAQAVARGANLVITHEPTFYNHVDEEESLAGDATYQSKRKFIDEHGLAIWRSHDLPHIHQPDMIETGMIRELGWENGADPELPCTYNIKPQTLQELIEHCKAKLGIRMVKYVGDPKMICTKAVLCVGGGGGQFEKLLKPGVQVVLAGESPEWITCEYARDAVAAGEKKALIVLGHANSEEGGMKWMAEWIAGILPEVKVEHIPAGDPFRFA
jgi:putative NIF3 family GTP cyclohydrolase 1 type 2